MYCVKCGVKLQDGLKQCPLCQTMVYYPSNDTLISNNYPDHLPTYNSESNMPTAIAFSFICAVAILVLAIICFNLYGEFAWLGYPVWGIVLFYIIFILPCWFRNPHPVIFSSIDFFAIALYLFYINFKVNGHWFFSFALPLVVIVAIAFITIMALSRFLKKAGFYIIGGTLIYFGFASVLIEFFQSLTFHTHMFVWSLYSLTVLFGFGIFLIIAAINRPLKNYLEKRFFI